ncbi:MAG: RsmB/NOP family class I SAM-dependent RNA methyltransferase [Alphaproteobacteria bacterium]|nr:RsmB/NOP family class I SAM-dependent RNA methyltransferase [Alphaproteobacteria bacterium]
MTPGARAAAAIELLDAIEADSTRPADALVTGWFRKRRFAGGGDRRTIQTVLYTVLRRRAQIDWWLEAAGRPVDSRGRVVVALVLGEKWSMDDLDAAFDGGQYRPAPLDEGERTLAESLTDRAFDDPAQPLFVRGNIPAWMEAEFSAVLGESLESELAAMMCEAPVDLRINSQKTTREAVAAMLAKDGIDTEPTPYSPLGLRLAGRVNLANSPVIRDGLAEPQDESSQIAALLTRARPGESVVDFCAGAGGKTLALAAMMKNQGRIVACDTSPGRLERARPRLERAGATIAELQVLDGENGLWPGAREGYYDCVLVDAPCSGTGTWRRHPEVRWQFTSEDLQEYMALQSGILDAASRLVAPGGRLIYAVCSLLAGEGEGQVADFLRRNQDFDVFPVREIWETRLDSECPAGDVFLRLRPGRDGTDGFFVAVLKHEGQPEPILLAQ